MNARQAGRTAAVVVVLVVLQFIVQPLLAWRAAPDFVVMAVLYAAVRMRPGWAAVLGFGLGLATDSLALSGFGAGALALAVVGFGASWLKGMFFADNVAINAAFLFLGKWAFDIVYVIAQHGMSFGALAAQVLVWSVLSAAMTAVVGIVALAMLRPLGGDATS
ncbi:MAG TPA: rod shape-determining protein MreD [Gemmatimonadaceae bacterium]